jgi:putative ABC transport system substrate-binding protein
VGSLAGLGPTLLSPVLGGCASLSLPSGSARRARVGILAADRPAGQRVDAFRRRLDELGWVSGRNLAIEERYAAGRSDRLPDLAVELVRLPADVIVTAADSGALAAKQATTTIPVVMATSADPVGRGTIASLARPGGNVTGLSQLVPQLNAKRIELLRDCLPGTSRVALLWDGSGSSPSNVEASRVAARQLGLEVLTLDVHPVEDIAPVIAAAQDWRADALMVEAGVFLLAQRDTILSSVARHRLPAIYATREWTDGGGLMSYGPDQTASYRRAAEYVDRILRGTHPSELPVEQASSVELVVNFRTVQTLGVTIPPHVASQVTEWVQ